MKKTVACILIALMCTIILLPKFTYANEIKTEDFKQIYDGKDSSKVVEMGGSVLGVVQIIGTAAGVICLLILGIKYIIMSYSADDKANIKEKLIPYVIGAVLLFGGSGLLSVIANFANKMDTPGTESNSQTNYTITCRFCGLQVPENLTTCTRCYRRLK